MRKLLLLLAVLSPVLLVYLSKPSEKPVETVTTPVVRQVEQLPPYTPPTPEKLLELTNIERQKAGVKPLILDQRLNQSAQIKVEELVKEGWDDTPHQNNQGVRGYTYIGETMKECKVGGENLANYYEPNPILGFKNSEPHWNAILSTKFEYIGFAVKETYLVVHFCSID